jgi:predicted RNase H-like HicB family nuclease
MFKFENMKLTIVISKGEEYFIGTIKEIPGVITQGETIQETKDNVIDALQLYLKAMESESEMENVVLEEDLSINYVG